jgi:hypothetical protein
MKGSPRSLWLSLANRAAAHWAKAVTAELRRQQRAFLKSLSAAGAPPREPKRRRRRK